MITKTLRLAVLAPAIVLGGCVSFGAEPPPSLLTLTPTEAVSAGVKTVSFPRSFTTLAEFDAPASIDVTRVPVQVNDSEIAYLKDAVWVEKPARLFRRLIVETIRARGGVVTDNDDLMVGDNDRVYGTVRRFGYDAPSSSVIVTFDAVKPGV